MRNSQVICSSCMGSLADQSTVFFRGGGVGGGGGGGKPVNNLSSRPLYDAGEIVLNRLLMSNHPTALIFLGLEENLGIWNLKKTPNLILLDTPLISVNTYGSVKTLPKLLKNHTS